MEYLDGAPLSDIVKNNPLPLGSTLHLRIRIGHAGGGRALHLSAATATGQRIISMLGETSSFL